MGALINAITAQLQIFVTAISGPLGILIVSGGLAILLIGVLWFELHTHYLVKGIITSVALLAIGAIAAGLHG